MLDLVRLSRRPLFPPGGRELYRQIGILTEMGAGDEVLVAACGPGLTLEYFVREYEVQGSGADPDPELVSKADARVRAAGLHGRLQIQQAPMESLPYRDGVFDVVLGELGLTADAEPEAALRELVRVTRPGGRIVLVQLVWKAPVDPARREVLSRHLGARPLMLVELKRLLRSEGIGGIRTEDWSDEETAFRPTVTKPFPDFAELFSIPEKLGILGRAWSRWGWRGVKAAVQREREVHRLLTRERVLGLDLLIGRKDEDPARTAEGHSPDAEDASPGEEEDGKRPRAGGEGTARADGEGTSDAPDGGAADVREREPDPQTRDLPLFTSGEKG